MGNQEIIYLLASDPQTSDAVRNVLATGQQQVKVCASADAFYDSYDAESCGCLITGFRLADGSSGLDVLEEIERLEWLAPAVVLTSLADVPTTVKAMRLGAIDVIEKPFRDMELWGAINRALTLARSMHQMHLRQQGIRRKIASLNDQERTIMNYIVDGQPNKVIASRIDVSLRTVESRRKSIYQKLETDNVAGFVSMVREAQTPLCSCRLRATA